MSQSFVSMTVPHSRYFEKKGRNEILMKVSLFLPIDKKTLAK